MALGNQRSVDDATLEARFMFSRLVYFCFVVLDLQVRFMCYYVSNLQAMALENQTSPDVDLQPMALENQTSLDGDFQDIMILSIGAKRFEEAMQMGSETYHHLKPSINEYERFRAIGNESIHDYFIRFHKLINDMKITQLDIPAHQMNTKFVNNLPPYWAKYVTNVKNNKDISATTYVELYTYHKSYELHAMKTL
nr:cytosolic enolase 3 [Tanacetum cinerariifolium]